MRACRESAHLRIAHSYRISRNILGHHGSSTDCATITNIHSGNNHDIATNPTVISN
eukprot:gene34571-42646_t